MTGGASIQLDGVRFSYGETRRAFDLAIEPSRIVAPTGPRGAGKSTLLNLIAGFEAPAAGTVMIGDSDVTAASPAARPVSMVFQENNLFAHLDVRSNVGLGRSAAMRLSPADAADIRDALTRTG